MSGWTIAATDWKFGINDPSAIAWLIFATFFFVAYLSWRVSATVKRTATSACDSYLWIILTILLVLLGFNKQLDLHQLLIGIVRDLVAENGAKTILPFILGAIVLVVGFLAFSLRKTGVSQFRMPSRHLFLAYMALFFFLAVQVVRFLPGPASGLLLAHVITEEEGLLHIHVIELIELASLIAMGYFARAVLLASSPTAKRKHVLMLLENAGIPEDHRVVREAETLFRAGFEVSIICSAGRKEKYSEKIGNVQVYRFPESFSPSGFVGYLWEYGYSIAMFFIISMVVLLRRGIDVIHVHTPPDMTAVVGAFYQLFGKKFVFDHHDLSPELYLARRQDDRPNLVYRVLRGFERFACRRANRLIATNQTQQSVQIERAGANPEHCYIVRNGPDERFFGLVEPLADLRKPGKIILGYVGVIGIQDGVDYMIRVVHALKFKYQRADFLAVVVGYGTALEDVKRLARELDVEDCVHFTGRVPFSTVPSHVAAFDICFTPDPSNPYNDSCTTIKTMEYMSLGKPTVCFRTKENQNTAGDSAVYADQNNVPQFAELTIRLMDDPSLRQQMGVIARQRIDNGLKWEHQATQLVRLYDSLFGNSSYS